MDYKKYIAQKLNVEGMQTDEIAEAIMIPPTTEMGDYALPCFKFSKTFVISAAFNGFNMYSSISR